MSWEFVETGGSLLSFGTGAMSSPREISGAASISKQIMLGFYDKPTGMYIHLTHGQGDKIVEQSHDLQAPDGSLVEGIYGRGPGEFTGFDDEKGYNILARFSKSGSIAALKKGIGKGRIAVWASNIEVPLTKATTTSPNVSTAQAIAEGEKCRLDLLKTTLLALSLRFPSIDELPVLRPLPQFLVSTPGKPTIVPTITDLVAAPSPGSQLSVFRDENDTFHFHHSIESATVLQNARENTSAVEDPSQWQPKHIILCPTSLPDRDQIPLFDLDSYFESLSSARKVVGCRDTSDTWGMGEALFYGEVITSTQTMLDK
ncbi:hypothetical protein C0992_010420 [Termitomyces sp. T32_za158]|nr:hypothetical protein C0992_010420 [Termitomyces sp. T32_za158]